jgi:hypothetical protein
LLNSGVWSKPEALICEMAGRTGYIQASDCGVEVEPLVSAWICHASLATWCWGAGETGIFTASWRRRHRSENTAMPAGVEAAKSCIVLARDAQIPFPGTFGIAFNFPWL